MNQYLPLEIHADFILYSKFATTRRYKNSDMMLEPEDLSATIDVAGGFGSLVDEIKS